MEFDPEAHVKVRECMKHGGCCSRLIHQRHVQRFVEELPQNRNTAQSAEERRSCNRFHYQTRAAPYDYTTSAARTETCSRAIRQSLIRRGRMARTPLHYGSSAWLQCAQFSFLSFSQLNISKLELIFKYHGQWKEGVSFFVHTYTHFRY